MQLILIHNYLSFASLPIPQHLAATKPVSVAIISSSQYHIKAHTVYNLLSRFSLFSLIPMRTIQIVLCANS